MGLAVEIRPGRDLERPANPRYFLKRYLSGPVVTTAKIDEAESYYAGHFPEGFAFNRAGWEHIVKA